MDCRPGCGACCIAPSISSPLPGMPLGKPAGVRCVNLGDGNLCRVWGTAEYPTVCRLFPAMADTCGSNAAEALQLLTRLEEHTAPAPPTAHQTKDALCPVCRAAKLPVGEAPQGR